MIRLDLLSTMEHITEKISPLYPVYFDLTKLAEVASWRIVYGTSDWTNMIGGDFIRIFAKDNSILVMLKLMF